MVRTYIIMAFLILSPCYQGERPLPIPNLGKLETTKEYKIVPAYESYIEYEKRGTFITDNNYILNNKVIL